MGAPTDRWSAGSVAGVDGGRAGELVVDRHGVTVHVLGRDHGTDDALAFIDAAEEAAGAPLVDESERARIHTLVGDEDADLDGWYPLVARRDGGIVGYAGVVAGSSELTGDVVVTRTDDGASATTSLFEAVRRIAVKHEAARATVWIRHADPADVACAGAAGFEEHRRLLVLGRSLDEVASADLPEGWQVRDYAPGDDDRAVVRVLATAFAGTPDAGWDLERLAERRSYDWFDPADLLVAQDRSGRIRAVHWTKRRDGDTGEVYVLAVAPDTHGSGLGRGMLRAGLHHLVEIGCEDVILWVDASNRRAVALYEAEGFTERWVDVAFATRAP